MIKKNHFKMKIFITASMETAPSISKPFAWFTNILHSNDFMDSNVYRGGYKPSLKNKK